MANSADPDQLASPTEQDLHCLQRQGISGFSRTRVNIVGIFVSFGIIEPILVTLKIKGKNLKVQKSMK